MNSIPFVLQCLALLFTLFAALGLFPNRVQWGWLGLCFWFLSFMIGGLVLHQAGAVH